MRNRKGLIVCVAVLALASALGSAFFLSLAIGPWSKPPALPEANLRLGRAEGSGKVRIVFTPLKGITSYAIYYREGGTVGVKDYDMRFTRDGVSADADITWRVPKAGKAYSIIVCAVKGKRETPSEGTLAVTSTPSPPYAFRLYASGCDEIWAQWIPSEGAFGYDVYEKRGEACAEPWDYAETGITTGSRSYADGYFKQVWFEPRAYSAHAGQAGYHAARIYAYNEAGRSDPQDYIAELKYACDD